MKQIKAFVHHNRVGDLVRALEEADFHRISLFEVKGFLHALRAREQDYSVDLGGKVINEVQVEVCCDDGEVSRAVEIVRRVARTGHADAGWIYVSPIEQTFAVGDNL
ncbi:MAG: P-II family nitrogen regulator [Rudaea sp.]|uniref:P-II family nitrogen regulator n=1 Tax=unclassified Rudaea TaxID=2627037 RepID=UPI0010F7B636|nr:MULTISPECIES: P-II family nitrogen regulator [unclassified Rudaea]MBN8885570.1 P-II family nitrogen regulator [Rudaea sp.]MBR0347748.1 P-II family nitrogen regulator [Rudaea sp.]